MSQEKTSKVWTKPEVKRLGVIKDVAGQEGAGGEAGGTKT